MVNININKERNKKLNELYSHVENKFLAEYEKVFGDKVLHINKFGILDEKNYDADNGILFILKETNGWSDKDFQEGNTYIEFLRDVAEKGKHINDGRETAERVKMNMWYTIGRWITTIKEPSTTTNQIAEMFDTATDAMKFAAYTNVNKVRGYASSRSKYWKLAQSDIAINTIKEEVNILNPKTIIFGGTYALFENSYIEELKKKGIKTLDMWHPAARKPKAEMIEEIKRQLSIK